MLARVPIESANTLEFPGGVCAFSNLQQHQEDDARSPRKNVIFTAERIIGETFVSTNDYPIDATTRPWTSDFHFSFYVDNKISLV